MTQKQKKPPEEEKQFTEDRSPSDVPMEDSEVRGTIEASRKAIRKSVEEIERAKRLLRETEELGDIPDPSHPRQPGESDKAS